MTVGGPSPSGQFLGIDPRRFGGAWVALALVAILAFGAALRFTGLNWDEGKHLHPDERFLTMVETSIQLPQSLGQYFDTAGSPLNPHNVGYPFFVYGTLPIFLVRVLAEWTANTGYDQVTLVGRAASAVFDLLSVLLVYAIGAQLYRRKVGLVAAAFAACSVLLIQHAHFFVVDSFANTFILAGIYFAVRVLDGGGWRDYLAFGLALGMALASKVSAAPLAGMVALAALARVGKAPAEVREQELTRALIGLVSAAAVFFVAFRVFQPYAFSGPTILGVSPNPRWLANLAEIRHQASGAVDFPPALQWADRTPVLFAWKNMVLWGMGLPLGLAAWIGFGWAALRMIRGDWWRHWLPVIWTAGYFLWQSSGFTPSMRYQMPVYPTLALLASWALWELHAKAASAAGARTRLVRAGALALGALVVAATAAWAVAFTSIYTRPVTRVAASRWIYTHTPGVANLVVDRADESLLETFAMPLRLSLLPGQVQTTSFVNERSGIARALLIPLAVDLAPDAGPKTIFFRVFTSPDPTALLTQATYSGALPAEGETRLEVLLDPQVEFFPGRTYYVEVELAGQGAVEFREPPAILVSPDGQDQVQTVRFPEETFSLGSAEPFTARFTSHLSGTAAGVRFPHVTAISTSGAPVRLQAALFEETAGGQARIAAGEAVAAPGGEAALELRFDSGAEIREGSSYLVLLLIADAGALTMRGSVIISESTWDDGLPLDVDARGIGGRYASANQELYWADDQDDDHDGVSDKLARIVGTLSEGDLLAITSNRQYGTIARVPVRYPLTTAYYRALLDCQGLQTVASCADDAQPGTLPAALGYELVAVFESNPRLGPFEISDQGAEEAFTVYDHPQVLLFARTDEFSAESVRELLGQVDVSRVVHVLPGEASSETPRDLLLPAERLAEQRAGGTWSELFHRESLVNRSPLIATVAWWALIALIGLLAFPLTRAAFPGLADGGYPLARTVGLVVVAWGAWMLGSARVPFGRVSILAVVLAMGLLSASLVWRDRQGLRSFWRLHRREIAWTELLALALFLIDLAIRLGNPDLWHPSKGGEKPMDLSYLNAVLKSTSFPPYDPWFAGGYINYYYYGFVLIAVPIKLLGLIPSTAYNLAIPTMFSLLGLTAYGVGFNLVARWKSRIGSGAASPNAARLGGIAAAVGIVLLGNLGTARMLYEGLKRIGAPAGEAPSTFIAGALEAARGAARFITLESPMPYALDSWYWDPSRAIPPAGGEAGPITEFPFFTFLYADLHAHMIVRPLAVLGLAWGLSWLLSASDWRRRRWWEFALPLFVGALVLGAIRPTNLGDYPTYWGLGAAAAGLGVLALERRLTLRSVLGAGLAAAVLLGLAYVLYLPYHTWYGQGYGAVEPWRGSRTPLSAYLTVHGVFLFALASWMLWETREWLASTPLSALAPYRRLGGVVGAAAGVFVVAVVALVVLGYPVALVVLPGLALAGLLFLRPGMSPEKRFVLTLTGAALALTFVVEVVVARGDISRMNTVFKFYLQVWELFAVGSAAAVVWVWTAAQAWRPTWRQAWAGLLTLLVAGAALYPLLASIAKIRDRWISEAPHALDGTAFMPYATYFDMGAAASLAEDYRAIQWMQDNAQGSPVIVEANLPEYRWGSRFTIYTGLPGVLGWNWHQRQQRVLAGDQQVWDRAYGITSFYLTPSAEEAAAFLQRYDVSYVIVGGAERIFYEQMYPCLPDEDGLGVTCSLSGRPLIRNCGEWCPFDIPVAECVPLDPQADPLQLRCPTHGLEKFERMAEQGLLRVAYRDGETVIYEVVR